MAEVRLEGVRKVFDGDTVAVAGATFEVEDGEFVVLVGPSGCGKSTTLRMIAGLERATEGRISIGDRVVNNVPPKDRDIAMVFQNYALYPHMTAYENMAFGLKLRKYDKKEIDDRVREAAEILSIEPILDRQPKHLSGGQRQRVAVGRAIVRKPKVFLFDEPLSNLDAKLRSGMRAELLKLHQQLEATMIYVTHDQVEAMTMGDRIVVLRDGHIQQIDKPLSLYNRPVNQFVAGFIGSPSMNFVSGQLVRPGGSECMFRGHNGQFEVPVEGAVQQLLESHEEEGVILGIRPEHIYLAGSSHITGPTGEVELQLEVVEPMGNEMVITVSPVAGEQQLIARIAPQPLPDPGEMVKLAFDLSELHFFDAETGEVLQVQQVEASLK